MSTVLPATLACRVASLLRARMEHTVAGHCVRVDDLTPTDALAIAQAIRNTGTDFDVHILAPDSLTNGYEIAVDRAIELRNRKQRPLLLLIPAGADRAASSLDNSFRPIPLLELLAQASTELERQLAGSSVASGIRELRRVLGRSRGIEPRLRFLEALAAEANWQTFGRHLWQVGLIPDLGDDHGVQQRLRANAKAVAALARPARTTSVVAERLAAAGVKEATESTIRQRLLVFFEGEAGVLPDVTSWTRLLGDKYPEDLTFERWPIAEPQHTALTEVTQAPFLRNNGSIDPACKLRLGDDGQIYCDVSADQPGTVVVRWTTDPVKPTSVASWRLEVIPPEDLRERDTVPVATKKVKGDKRRAVLSLSLDEDDLETGCLFVVRLRAQDADGNDLLLTDGCIAETESDSFVVLMQDHLPDRNTRKTTASSLPEALLQTAVKGANSLTEDALTWDLAGQAFGVRVGNRQVVLVRASRVLVGLQRRLLTEPTTLAFSARSELGAPITPESSEPITLALPPTLAERRRKLLTSLAQRQPRDVVEVVTWDEELREQARAYLLSYRRALDGADESTRAALLTMDTVLVRASTALGDVIGLVLLPTHPLRLNWIAVHDQLLRAWAQKLAESRLPAARRATQIDLTLAARLSPANMPFSMVTESGDPFVYAEELTYGSALYLPVGTAEPESAIDAICSALEVARENAGMRAAAQLVGHRIASYRTAHPGTDSLRLMAVNPGSGVVIRRALDPILKATEPTDVNDINDIAKPPRTQVITYTNHPSYTDPVPELRQLQLAVAGDEAVPSTTHLTPPMGLAVRSLNRLTDDGESHHIAIVQDPTRGRFVASDTETSRRVSTFGDLLTPLITEHNKIGAGSEWHALPALRPRGGHVASDIVDAHRSHQLAVGAHLGLGSTAPTLSIRLQPDDLAILRATHARADWVVTLDRHLGHQLYEDPIAVGLGPESYLLDYAPDFIEGFGDQLTVTTAHRGEVQRVLHDAMDRIGLSPLEHTVSTVLEKLSLVSGRLALRLLANTTLATEAVSLAALMAHLERRNRLDGLIVIPIDAHPEIFGVHGRLDEESSRRCDLLLVRVTQRSLRIECIEVKSRRDAALPLALADRIVDQLVDTHDLLISRFFAVDPARLDGELQRSRLAGLLHHYAARSAAYGLVAREKLDDLHRNIDRVTEQPEPPEITMTGYVVSLEGKAGFPDRHRGVPITVLTAADLGEAGFTTQFRRMDIRDNDSSPMVGIRDQDAGNTDGVNGGSTETGERARNNESSIGASPVTIETGESFPAQPPGGADGNPPPKPAQLVVELGRDQAGGAVQWELSTKGSPHAFILGIPGQGKSVTIRRIIRQLASNGLPSLVFDFHGDMATNSPTGTQILDASAGLPFTPFELAADDPRVINETAWELSEVIAYVCGLGEIQRNHVYRGLQQAYEIASTNGSAIPTMTEFAEAVELVEQDARGRNARDRIRPLTDFGLFSAEPNQTFDPATSSGTIVDVSRLGLEAVQLAAGAFLLRKVYRDMFHWKQDSTMKLAIVLDEAHRLAKDVTLPKLMKEGRKYGVAVIVASQGMSDFHRDVLGNSGTKIVFRTNYPASKAVAGFLRGRGDQDLSHEIEQLGIGAAYVSTPDHTQARRVYMHTE